MGLAETQRLLARLCTDADLRERFFADSITVGAEWGLTPEEARQVAALPSDRVAFFARSLRAKRLGEVRKLLPLTARLLGPRLPELFMTFADGYRPAGVKKHQDDAVAFAAFVSRTTGPPGLRDLARYEAGWLRMADPARRWLIVPCRCDVRRLARSLGRGEAPDVRFRPSVTLWLRLGRQMYILYV